MTGTAELRSIYSGPIRRALEHLDRSANEVAIGTTAPTDGSELWVNPNPPSPTMSVKIDGIWMPIAAVTPGWIPVTFLGGWVDWTGTGRSPTQYRKLGDMVHLRIAARFGTNGTAMFTLPAGYRPPGVLDFIPRCPAGSPVINVNTNGDVVWYGTDSAFVCLSVQFSVTA